MTDVAFFAAKVFIVFFAVAGLAVLIAVMASRASHHSELKVDLLHKKFRSMGNYLKSFTLSKSDRKKQRKLLKEEEKKEDKAEPTGKVFVINFKGDKDPHQVENLREEITAILQLASDKDEVVVKVESPGGTVHGYGLAAAQLLRLRDKKILLTVCVDKVAASGGYMMACVANKIFAAPFAIIGSIGVVAPVPNINKLLKHYDIEYKEYTAGEFKRTVSLMGEITPKGEQKFQEQLEDIHAVFKSFVQSHRPQINISEVATGEYWLGKQAKALGLIDEISTSDDYLLAKYAENLPLFQIKYEVKPNLVERVSDLVGQSLTRASERLIAKFENRFLL